jgi:hypothetical protein
MAKGQTTIYNKGNNKITELRTRADNTMAKCKRIKDKRRSTKYTHKIKDRVTRNQLG